MCLEPPTVYYLPLSAAGDGEEEDEGDDDAEAELAAAQAAEDQPLTAEDAERAAAADEARDAAAAAAEATQGAATPAGATQVGDVRRIAAAWAVLSEAMGSAASVKVGHNLKYQLALLLSRRIAVRGELRDPLIGAWMIDPAGALGPDGKDLSPRALAQQYATSWEKRLAGTRGTARDLCCKAAALTYASAASIEERLRREGLDGPYTTQEMPLVACLSRMELCGFRVHAPAVRAAVAPMAAKQKQLEEDAYRLAGRRFKFGSAKDIGRVLFDELQLGAGGLRRERKKTQSGRQAHACATSSAALELLRAEHPLPAMIVEHRQLSANLRNAIKSVVHYKQLDWLRHRDDDDAADDAAAPSAAAAAASQCSHGTPSQCAADGSGGAIDLDAPPPPAPPASPTRAHAVHTRILHTHSETGRLQTREPNLQSLPKPFEFLSVTTYRLAESLHAELSAALVPVEPERSTPILIELTPGAPMAPARLEQLQRRVASDAYDPARPTVTLADEWRRRGFGYTPEHARAVRQLRVRLLGGDGGGGGGSMIVPSDRVWRVRASTCATPQLRPPPGAVVLAPERRVAVELRDAFVARKGCVLLSADYCQVEMRLLAHFSKDADLIGALQDGAADLFETIARRLFALPPAAAVTAEQRGRAKSTSYAIFYGAGPGKLVEELAVELDDAKTMIEDWHAAFPTVKGWTERVAAGCAVDGFVTTINGRKRYLHGIRSRNDAEKRKARRQASNTVCQGSAADLIKQAMLHIDARLAPPDAPHVLHRAAPGRLLLQIHDELLFEVAEEAAPALRDLVREAMTARVAALRVPLQVRIKQGPTWGSLDAVATLVSPPSQAEVPA